MNYLCILSYGLDLKQQIKVLKSEILGIHFFFVVITWLNKQLNEIQMTRKQEVSGTSTSPSGATPRTGISPHSMVIVMSL